MSVQNSNDIEYGLLENGLDFILSSTEYLMSGKSKSDIKYGLLHLSSGIELVFKYRLFIVNREYVFQNLKEANHQKFLMVISKVSILKTCVERLKKSIAMSRLNKRMRMSLRHYEKDEINSNTSP